MVNALCVTEITKEMNLFLSLINVSKIVLIHSFLTNTKTPVNLTALKVLSKSMENAFSALITVEIVLMIPNALNVYQD